MDLNYRSGRQCAALSLIGFIFLAGFASATDISGCTLLNAADTYTLTADITFDVSVLAGNQTCFNITASDVLLDLAGHSIVGNNTENLSAVYIMPAAENANVSNGNFSNFSTNQLDPR